MVVPVPEPPVPDVSGGAGDESWVVGFVSLDDDGAVGDEEELDDDGAELDAGELGGVDCVLVGGVVSSRGVVVVVVPGGS